jgi:predicted  nucleic acid-binding Zn-ribbon protein
MASKMIGRAPCPECGFQHAHIKVNTDKENAKPYRYCPDCAAQYFPKNQAQADALTTKMRALDAPVDTPAEPVKLPEIQPPAAPAYKLVLGVRMPV